MKNVYIIFLILLIVTLSGCTGMGNEKIEEVPTPVYYNDTQYWNDSHQFNNAAMLVGYTNNTTMNYEVSNFSSNITIDLMCDFTPIGGAQGYFQLEIYDNNTMIYQNNSSESVVWHIETNISSNNINFIIQSEGFDSDPLTEYADYFIVQIENDVFAIISDVPIMLK